MPSMLLAPALLLLGDGGAARTLFIVTVTAVTLVGIQMGSAGWLVRNLSGLVRAALYGAGVLLYLGLLWDRPLLMGLAPSIARAVGALNALAVVRRGVASAPQRS